GLGTPGDVLIAISRSGGARSVRRAVATARALGMTTIAMTGAKGGEFAAMCDLALVTPHAATSHIQEGHIAMGHALCLMVERALFPAAAAAGTVRRRPARGKARRAGGGRSRRMGRSRKSAGGEARRGGRGAGPRGRNRRMGRSRKSARSAR